MSLNILYLNFYLSSAKVRKCTSEDGGDENRGAGGF